jgi:hypothetical protein
MSIQSKLKWTKYSMREGMRDGLPQRELNGETVLFVEEAPHELQEPLCRWLLVKQAEPVPSRPTIKGDRPNIDELRAYENAVDYTVRVDSQDKPAILWGAWEAFLDWMKATLAAELTRLED